MILMSRFLSFRLCLIICSFFRGTFALLRFILLVQSRQTDPGCDRRSGHLLFALTVHLMGMNGLPVNILIFFFFFSRCILASFSSFHSFSSFSSSHCTPSRFTFPTYPLSITTVSSCYTVFLPSHCCFPPSCPLMLILFLLFSLHSFLPP